LLGYVTGLVNQELLLGNEYLVAENRILKARINGRLRLSDGEKATLAEIAKRLGRKALPDIARVAKPDTRRSKRFQPPESAHCTDALIQRATSSPSRVAVRAGPQSPAPGRAAGRLLGAAHCWGTTHGRIRD
jgi:hypothetical protein